VPASSSAPTKEVASVSPALNPWVVLPGAGAGVGHPGWVPAAALAWAPFSSLIVFVWPSPQAARGASGGSGSGASGVTELVLAPVDGASSSSLAAARPPPPLALSPTASASAAWSSSSSSSSSSNHHLTPAEAALAAGLAFRALPSALELAAAAPMRAALELLHRGAVFRKHGRWGSPHAV
jgi:hypothetical protein